MTEKIAIKHRYTGAVLFEYQPTAEQQASGLAMDVISIRSAKRQRDKLLAYIRKHLSNAALCNQYGIHPRTLEKVLARETWSHLP